MPTRPIDDGRRLRPIRRASSFGAILAAALALNLAATATAPAQQEPPPPTTPQDFYILGETYLELGQFEKAREPLERALALAADDRMRLKVHKALMPVYFHTSRTDAMLGSLDVILTTSDVDPDRRAARDILIRYARQQGKTAQVRDRYEARLKADPDDLPALSVLSDLYAKLQPDPGRAGALVERLAAVMKKTGRDLVPYARANLARQFVDAGKLREGAALYMKAAEDDPTYAAWCYKEAAQTWLRAGERTAALDTACKADAAPPEGRSARLRYLWHRGLGDVFLQLSEPAPAIAHFEKALELTDKDEDRAGLHRSLDQARALDGTPTTGGAIDLNRASLAQLRSVDGIGEDLAVQIVARRKAMPFASVSELIELDGVDKALRARVRRKLTVGPR
jgi:tetratricopeptide (TPR) repeat protein